MAEMVATVEAQPYVLAAGSPAYLPFIAGGSASGPAYHLRLFHTNPAAGLLERAATFPSPAAFCSLDWAKPTETTCWRSAYSAGLIAGGLENGTVAIWDPRSKLGDFDSGSSSTVLRDYVAPQPSLPFDGATANMMVPVSPTSENGAVDDSSDSEFADDSEGEYHAEFYGELQRIENYCVPEEVAPSAHYNPLEDFASEDYPEMSALLNNNSGPGPNHAAVTACATGAHSIGDATRMIQFGDADVMVAGGTESSIDALSIAGFSRLRALTTKFNSSPEAASRPFDCGRDGFVIGEGCGIMVLEALDHAKERGAKIYAEVRGYGMSGDAHHITQPQHDGRGAILAMKRALEQSGLHANEIDYLNAHATSTPLGDAVEATAIKSVFGDHAASGGLAFSSTKGAIGHLLGAAGSVEAIFTVLAIHHGVAPLTLNLEQPDPLFEGAFVPLTESKKMPIRAAISNSFGFGGTNTSLLFSCPL